MLDCLINGEIGALIPVTDRGFNYGHGVFETLALHQGKALFPRMHWRRMSQGCERLGIPMPPVEIIERELATVAAGHNRAIGKVTLTAGNASRGYAVSGDVIPNRVVAAFAWPSDLVSKRRSGVSLRFCEQTLSHNRPLSRIKHLNRLEQVLARAEWSGDNPEDGLMLDEDDYVLGVTSGNLFIVSEGRLLTPRLDRSGVRGVTRDAILRQFQPLCEKRRITRLLLTEASEVFICNSVKGVYPITNIAEQDYPVGPITRQVQDWLADLSPLMEWKA